MVNKALIFTLGCILLFINKPSIVHAQSLAGSIHPNAVQLDFDRFLFIANGAIGIKKGDRFALVNLKGEFIVPYGRYEFSHSEREVDKFGLIKVKNVEPIVAETDPFRVGYINARGEVVIPLMYAFNQFFGRFDEFGIGRVAELYKTPTSNVLHKEIPYSKRTIAINLKGEKLSWLSEGNELPQYSFGYGNSKKINNQVDMDLIPVLDRNKHHGFIDGKGTRKTAFFDVAPYLEIRPYSDGLAAAQRRDEFGEFKWGFIDKNGKQAVPFKFTVEPGPFSSGLALVEPSNKAEFNYAYIDTTGNVKFTVDKQLKPISFGIRNLESAADAGYFINGFSYWRNPTKGETILYKPDGTSVMLQQFVKDPVQSTNFFVDVNHQGRLLLHVGNKIGELGMNGAFILPPEFTYLTPDHWAAYYYAQYDKEDTRIEGVVNREGVFILIKSAKKATTW